MSVIRAVVRSVIRPVVTSVTSRYGAVLADPGTLTSLAFAANDASYLGEGVVTGTGNTTAHFSSDRFVLDYNGKMQRVPQGDSAAILSWRGRTVVNWALHSGALNNAAWATTSMTVGMSVSDPDGGNSAATLTATAGAAQWRQVVTNLSISGMSGTNLCSIWIRRRTGTGGIRMYKGQTTNWSTITGVDSTWRRFVAPVGTATGSDSIGINLETSGDAVDVWHPMLESSGYAEKTDTPSEYVESGASEGVATYWCSNGNTKSGNIVTEAVGTAYATEPYYYGNGEFTTDALQSNAFTTSPWTFTTGGSAAQNATGPNGATDAWTITSDGSSSARVYQIFTQDTTGGVQISRPTGMRTLVKKTTSSSSFPAIWIAVDSTALLVQIDTDNGVPYVISPWDNGSAEVFSWNTDYWCVCANADTCDDTQTFPQFSIYPSTGGTLGTYHATTAGSNVFWNVELYQGKSIGEFRLAPPILTTTAPVTVDNLYYSFSAAEHSAALGLYQWEVSSSFTMSSVYDTSNQGLWTFNGATVASGFMTNSTAPNDHFKFNDGVGANNVSPNDAQMGASREDSMVWTSCYDSTAALKYSSGWNATKSQGSSSAVEKTYDGSFGATTYRVGYNFLGPLLFKRLKYYTPASYADAKAYSDQVSQQGLV